MNQHFGQNFKQPMAPDMDHQPILFQPPGSEMIQQQPMNPKHANAPMMEPGIMVPPVQYNSQMHNQQGMVPMQIPMDNQHVHVNPGFQPQQQQNFNPMHNPQVRQNFGGNMVPQMHHHQPHQPMPLVNPGFGGPQPVVQHPMSGPVPVVQGGGGGDSGPKKEFSSRVLKQDKEGRWYARLEDDSAGRTLSIIALSFLIAAIAVLPIGFIFLIVGISLVVAGLYWAAVFIALGGAAIAASIGFAVVVISTFATGNNVTALRATFDVKHDLLIIHYVNQLRGKEECGGCEGDECGVKDEVKLSQIVSVEAEKESGLKKFFGSKDKIKCNLEGGGKPRIVGGFGEARFRTTAIPAMNEFLNHFRS